MNTRISPLEQQLHMKQLEQKIQDVHYDHLGAPLTGWKAERQYCKMRQLVNGIKF